MDASTNSTSTRTINSQMKQAEKKPRKQSFNFHGYILFEFKKSISAGDLNFFYGDINPPFVSLRQIMVWRKVLLFI